MAKSTEIWLGTAVLVLALAGCGDAPGRMAGESSARPAAAQTAPAQSSQMSVAATVTPEPTATPTSPNPTTAPPTSAPPSAAPTVDPTSPDDPSPPDPDPPSEEERLEAAAVELTNAERTAAGCPEVHVDDRLTEASRGHSEDMVERDFFDHTNPDGETPWDRASAAGYEWAASENIAWGHRTAEAVVAGWMNSDGHRRNILDCDVVAVGIGVADSSRGPYWTQMFGRR